jgi:Flp pilus assembly protein TadD
VTFAAALARAISRPTDSDVLDDLARAALEASEEQQALPVITKALAVQPSARLWQWKSLLERALDDHEPALASFAEAAHLDPGDPGIAHGRARVALEAGLPPEALYEQALRLAPNDSELRIGLAAARLAAGHGEQAEHELTSLLEQAPLWIQGHVQLAQLRSMLGRRADSARSIEHALSKLPQHTGLWQALFDLHMRSEDFAGLSDSLARARQADVPDPALLPYEAIAAAELARTDEADRLFDVLDRSSGVVLPIWRIRHLLRTGRVTQALPLIDAELGSERAAEAWPYASLAWRLAADPRWEWLERDERLVWEADLTGGLPPLDELASVLRSLHVAKGEYLDQSVRGGTQTDGPLFSRIEPEIRTLRSAVVDAVEQYRNQLPAFDPKHPLLSGRRDKVPRFAGSWSVRLRSSGYHTSHVHPQGWISSALYVALPAVADDCDPNGGWLTMGEPPPGLPLDVQSSRRIEPKAGKLVLFPSWMWHGTVPFAAGERLTVAFDVRVPH